MDGFYATLRLYHEKPEYLDVVKKCVEAHKQELTTPYLLGFEWEDVAVMPVILTLLVTKYDLLEVTYKSNSSTCYMLKDIDNVEKALKDIDAKKSVTPQEGSVIRIWLSAGQRTKLKAYIDRELPGCWDPENVVVERAVNEFLVRNSQLGNNSSENGK